MMKNERQLNIMVNFNRHSELKALNMKTTLNLQLNSTKVAEDETETR